jgi:hypothetical protein
MRILFSFLLPLSLAAQGAGKDLDLDLRTRLGTDPLAAITLMLPGCWNGLLLGSSTAPVKQTRRSTPGRTVEVWDFALRESTLETGFRLLRADLREKLSRAWEAPPPVHGQIELGILSGTVAAQGNLVGVDQTIVLSLQERFNQLPPNGSPVLNRP